MTRTRVRVGGLNSYPEKKLLPVDKAAPINPPPTDLAVDAALDVYVIIPSRIASSDAPLAGDS